MNIFRLIIAIFVSLVVAILAPAAHAADPYEEGSALYEAERYAEAADAFELYESKYPEGSLLPAAIMSAAWAHIHADHPESALDAIERLEAGSGPELFPDLMLYTKAMIFAELERHDEAVELFQRVSIDHDQSPLHTDADLLRARSLLEIGRAEDALKLAEIIVLATPSSSEAREIRLEARLKKRKNIEALEDINFLLPFADAKRLEELIITKAGIEESIGSDYLFTLSEYLRLFPRGPRAARVHRMLAEATHGNAGRLRHLTEAILLGDAEPFVSENRMTISELLMERGDTRGAAEQWKRLVIFHGQSLEALEALRRISRLPSIDALVNQLFTASVELILIGRSEELVEGGYMEEALAVYQASLKVSSGRR